VPFRAGPASPGLGAAAAVVWSVIASFLVCGA
jgi:hypothetical protein